jgi:hypothetical protein
MKASIIISSFACLLNLGAVLAQTQGSNVTVTVEEQQVNYFLGTVDGMVLPGSLASLDFSPTGQLIASMLELNISARDFANISISLDDTTNPCIEW